MGLPIPEWFDPTQTRDGDGMLADGLRPSEVVHQTIPDPAEQAPLVARSVTPPSPSGRGGTTLLRQRAPRSCTVFVMTPPDEHTSEGGRDDRGVPYHAESTLSSAQVLKVWGLNLPFKRLQARGVPLLRPLKKIGLAGMRRWVPRRFALQYCCY